MPIDKINLSKQEKLILNNMFVTDIFRVNQILLFYYTFDNISDYSRFLNDKLIKIKHNGIKEVVKSFKKIK
jgi:hypothetical protein